MKVVRDARQITGSGALSILMTATRSVLVLRILGPATLGIWKSVMLLYVGVAAFRLGVLRGMSLRVPVLEGQGKQDEARAVANTAGGFMIVLGAAAALAVTGAALLAGDAPYRTALVLMAVILFIAQPLDLLRELAAARHRFSLRANEMVLTAATDLVAAVALSWWFGLSGIALAGVISVLLPFLYLWRGTGFHFPLRFHFASLRGLVGSGFPYMAAEGAMYYLRYIDILIISLLLGPVYVGYYGLAVLVLEFSTALTKSSVSQLVMPHLLREYGRVGSATGVAVFYEVPARLISYLLPPLLGVASLLIPLLVGLFLPQYLPGIPAAQIVLLGGFFLTLHGGLSSFLSAAERIPSALRFFALLLPMAAVAQVAVIKAGFGLVGVAVTSVVIVAAGASGEIMIARRACGRGVGEIARYLVSLYFPLAYTWILTSVLSRWEFGGLITTWAEAPLRAVLLLVFYAPLLWAYENQFGLLKTVKESA